MIAQSVPLKNLRSLSEQPGPLLQHHAHSAFTYLGGKFVLFLHGSIYMDASRFARDFELV